MTRNRDTVVLIDDDAQLRSALREALSQDFEVLEASMAKTGRLRVDQGCDAVLLDIRLSDDHDNRDGLELLEEFGNSHPGLPVIMMTGYADMDTALRSLKAGAADFIQKEALDVRQLSTIIMRAIQRSRDQRRTEVLERRLREIEASELVGSSTAIREIRRLVDLVAQDGKATALITGESGTGKELAARMIHRRGRRERGPFVMVSVPALGVESIEAELFGAAPTTPRGSAMIGLAEQADGGVLFLDGICELPLALQGKLLRILESGTFQRVGTASEQKCDLQVIASSSVDLRTMVDAGRFRQDLYYRLKGFEIGMPPLRDIPGDIAALTENFLHELRQSGRTRVHSCSDEALTCLAAYRYPGNARELRSIIERAVITCQARGEHRIQPVDLPAELRDPELSPNLASFRWDGQKPVCLEMELAWLELLAFTAAMKRCEGRRQDAANLLGLPNRQALPRRVGKIRQDYPALLKRCTELQAFFPANGEERES